MATKYDFNIGDLVRVQYQNIDIEGVIVERDPSGGGENGLEPLYWIRSNTVAFDPMPKGHRRHGLEGRFHAMWIRLLQRAEPDYMEETDIQIDISLI